MLAAAISAEVYHQGNRVACRTAGPFPSLHVLFRRIVWQKTNPIISEDQVRAVSRKQSAENVMTMKHIVNAALIAIANLRPDCRSFQSLNCPNPTRFSVIRDGSGARAEFPPCSSTSQHGNASPIVDGRD